MPSPPLFESCHAESTEYLLGRKRAGGIGVNSAGISDQPRFRQDGRRGLPFSHSLVSMSFISARRRNSWVNRVNRWLRALLQTGGGGAPPRPPQTKKKNTSKTKTKTLLRRKNKKRSALSRWSEIEHDTSLAGSRWLPDGHRSAANRRRKMAIGTRSGADLGIPGRFRRDPKCGF